MSDYHDDRAAIDNMTSFELCRCAADAAAATDDQHVRRLALVVGVLFDRLIEQERSLESLEEYVRNISRGQ